MKGTKILGTVLVLAVLIVMAAPVAFAQTHAGILDGQWFKIKLGVKGYRIAGDTVLGKGSGSVTSYLFFSYNGVDGYTIATCTQDDLNSTDYHPILIVDAILTEDIYGEAYPQVWEFGGTPLEFDNGASVFYAYPTLYTKITADGATLKNASISNVACILSAKLSDDDAGANYAAGSCSISGPVILPANVANKVPLECQYFVR
jgi:hypothetical protein